LSSRIALALWVPLAAGQPSLRIKNVWLAKKQFGVHSRRMGKKRSSGWDGIRDIYHLHQAMEMLETLRRSGGKVLEQIIEMAMMVAAGGDLWRRLVAEVTFWGSDGRRCDALREGD
jgi:hypothetical protein